MTAPRKRLVRRTDDKMIAGVCSGVADYLGVDVTLVRVLTVLLAVFGFGHRDRRLPGGLGCSIPTA